MDRVGVTRTHTQQDGCATASPCSLAVTKGGNASSASAEKGSIVSKAARNGLTIVLTPVGKARYLPPRNPTACEEDVNSASQAVMADPRLRAHGLVNAVIMDEIEAKLCNRMEDASAVKSKVANDIGLIKLSRASCYRIGSTTSLMFFRH